MLSSALGEGSPFNVLTALEQLRGTTEEDCIGGQTIKAWLIIPRPRSGTVICVVQYIGYGGGRGFDFEWVVRSSAGHAALILAMRGQGGDAHRVDTPAPAP